MWKASPEKGQRFIFTSRNLRRSGFTLVEMMVVVALVVVIASIAIGVLLRARLQSNESATVGNLRTISSGAEGFRGTQNPPAYPASLVVMAQANPPYLDSSWITTSDRQGYTYSYFTAVNNETYATVAVPRTLNTSGINSYCVDHTGVIRRYAQGGSEGNAAGCNANGAPL